jgi:hypothetical protein
MPETVINLNVTRNSGNPNKPNRIAYEATISVVSTEQIDTKIFVFHKQSGSNYSPTSDSYFHSVASSHQMAVLPDTEPDGLTVQDEPFFRSDSTGALSFPSSDEMEKFITAQLQDILALQIANNSLLSGVYSETDHLTVTEGEIKDTV